MVLQNEWKPKKYLPKRGCFTENRSLWRFFKPLLSFVIHFAQKFVQKATFQLFLLWYDPSNNVFFILMLRSRWPFMYNFWPFWEGEEKFKNEYTTTKAAPIHYVLALVHTTGSFEAEIIIFRLGTAADDSPWRNERKTWLSLPYRMKNSKVAKGKFSVVLIKIRMKRIELGSYLQAKHFKFRNLSGLIVEQRDTSKINPC